MYEREQDEERKTNETGWEFGSEKLSTSTICAECRGILASLFVDKLSWFFFFLINKKLSWYFLMDF